MKLERPLKIDEVTRMFGIERATLGLWVREGIVPVAAGGGQKGKVRKFDTIGLIAISIASSLRRQNAGTNPLKEIGKFFKSMTLEQLQANFYNGRTMLVASETLEPTLKKPGEVIANRSGGAALIIAIDLEAVYQILIEGLRLRAEQPQQQEPAT